VAWHMCCCKACRELGAYLWHMHMRGGGGAGDEHKVDCVNTAAAVAGPCHTVHMHKLCTCAAAICHGACMLQGSHAAGKWCAAAELVHCKLADRLEYEVCAEFVFCVCSSICLLSYF
jgi:hypothetical protein